MSTLKITSASEAPTFAPIADEPTHCRNCDLAKVNHGPNGECADAEACYAADRPCNCYYWTLTVHQCNSRKGQPVTQHWTPGTARRRAGGTLRCWRDQDSPPRHGPAPLEYLWRSGVVGLRGPARLAG